MQNKSQRFSISKFNVGIGSVLIGSLVSLGVSQNVSAEEVDEGTTGDQIEDIYIESGEEVTDDNVEVEEESLSEIDEPDVEEQQEFSTNQYGDLYEIVVEPVYKPFRFATTQSDIRGAITTPNYNDGYSVFAMGSLPGAISEDVTENVEYVFSTGVFFNDGTRRYVDVPVTVVAKGPNPVAVLNPSSDELSYGDDIPSPEVYLENVDEIRAYYAQYGMDITAVWGEPGETDEEIIDNYFSESNNATVSFLIDGEYLYDTVFRMEVFPDVDDDADIYDVVVERVFKPHSFETTREDILGAVTIPEYDGDYTVQITSNLPPTMPPQVTENREHIVDTVVRFADGSTKNVSVPVTLVAKGPDGVTLEGAQAYELTFDDELPNIEDYLLNLDEIQSYYEQYGFEVTANWGAIVGQSKESIIRDHFILNNTRGDIARITLSIDGRLLERIVFPLEILPNEADAEVYDVEVDHIYKGFESPKSPAVTEEDIVNAVTIPNYDGEYTVEVTSSLDGIRTPQNYEVEAVVIFEDGSTQNITVHVSVLPPGQAKKFFNGQ